MICQTVEQVWQPPDRKSPSEWAEAERKLNNAPGYVGPWRFSMAPYLREPLDKLASPDLEAVIFVGPAQCGKALDLTTPLATPGGWTTQGEVKPGDTIIGSKGQAITVTGVSQVWTDHNCAWVKFDDGTAIRADMDHLWQVRDIKESQNKGHPVEKILRTCEIMQDVVYGKLNRNRFAIPVAGMSGGFDLPPEILDPYLLGLWIGDGHYLGGRIYAHADDASVYAHALKAAGWKVTVEAEKTSSVLKVQGSPSGRFMVHQLSELGLIRRKHIPSIYLRASREHRLALLQGLMDSDGHVTKKGACSYNTTNQEIQQGVHELLVSLGFKVHVRQKLGSWNLHFTAYTEDRPCRLPRKMARLRSRQDSRPSEARSRFIVAVEPCESVPVKCLSVDAEDHLYLAGRSMVPTHNTELILNWAGYSIRTDPSDLTIFSPTQGNARDFSNRRVDRLQRDTPEIKKELLAERDADNKFDKHYKSGMILGLAWPTKAELAGKPIPKIALTDRDRMDDDIEGEGDPFELAIKRTTSFGSFAMTLCESSPSREITDYRAKIKGAHEAPPTKGILDLYNRGDRRRWYIPCGRCGEFLEPRFELLKWEENSSILDAAESVRMICPICDGINHPDERHTLQQSGLWLPEGCYIDQGQVVGTPRRSKYASYWLEGCSAAFTNWPKLVSNYLMAEESFESTLNEEPLKKFYNTDLGRPYKPKAMESERTPDDLIDRAQEIGKNEKGEIEIISDVAFAAATVDVQKNMFIVQIWGICPGSPYDIVLVERFDIRKSKRKDEDDDVLWVKPGTYEEDWDLLEEQVIRKTYPIEGQPGKRMGLKIIGCDSGGKAGVTSLAYKFWRKMNKKGLGQRFVLLKGTGTPTAPHVRESFPDASDKKNLAAARGDVPIWLLNSNLLKNEANNRLDSVEKGKGMVRVPKWMPNWLFSELCSEVYKTKGWVKLQGKKNEAWDLLYYLIGLCMTRYIRCERPQFWENLPVWANPLDPANPYIFNEDDEGIAERPKTGYDLTKLASKIA